MNKTFIAAGLLAVASMATQASAQIQTKTTVVTASNIAVRLGINFPFDQAFRNVAPQFAGLGVEYSFDKQFLPNSTTYISFDWLTRSFTAADQNVFPICLNQRFMLDNKVSKYQTYAFVGVGAVIFNIVTSQTVLGFRGGFGVDLGPNIFTEATLLITDPASGGYRANSAGLYVGYRF